MYHLHHQGDKNRRARNLTVLQLLVTVKIVPSAPNPVTLKIQAIHSPETSVLTRATRRNIPPDGILRYSTWLLAAIPRGRCSNPHVSSNFGAQPASCSLETGPWFSGVTCQGRRGGVELTTHLHITSRSGTVNVLLHSESLGLWTLSNACNSK
jgi:hypothetical protein